MDLEVLNRSVYEIFVNSTREVWLSRHGEVLRSTNSKALDFGVGVWGRLFSLGSKQSKVTNEHVAHEANRT